MKLNRYLLVIMLSLFSLTGFAQEKNVEVRGVVIEKSNNEPIEQAAVRLLGVKDSAMVQGVASSKNGVFSIKNVKPGSY